jgi:acetyl-CoA carboxylase carboxyltransferase component
MLHAAGFMVGKKAEAGGIAKDGAKMVMAVANVKVSMTRLATAVWAGGWLRGC